jgi:uroporphyrinogen-III synthase
LINKKLNHKIFTIGKATDKELLKYGYKSDYINEGNNSVIFSQNLANFINENDKTLLILGNLAPDSILNSINKYSSAQRINVYKTEKIKNFDNKISNYIENNKYDLILFSSPSAFYSFKESFPNIDLKKLKAACIGNITAKALLEQNIKPVLVADKSDYEGFIISIKNHFKKILN